MREPEHIGPRTLRTSARKGTLSLLMWVFGLSTTILLIGLWGRAVTVDQATITESAIEIVDADIARNRILGWVEMAMAESSAIGPAEARAVVTQVRESPQMDLVIDNSVRAFVGALFAPEGSDPVVDLGTVLEPVVPVVVSELREVSIPVDEATVAAALESSAMELDTGEAQGFVAVVTDARAVVNQAVAIALMLMLISGAAAIALAEARFAMVRTLAIRVLLSALSFAIIFRLGGWALDPERGRSPVAGATSTILGSNGDVFLIAAVFAATIAAVGGWIAWNRRVSVRADQSAEQSDDDTRELVTV